MGKVYEENDAGSANSAPIEERWPFNFLLNSSHISESESLLMSGKEKVAMRWCLSSISIRTSILDGWIDISGGGHWLLIRYMSCDTWSCIQKIVSCCNTLGVQFSTQP